MGKRRISKSAFKEVTAAFEEYRSLCTERAGEGYATPRTLDTYVTRAEYFVRWLDKDFEPFAKNMP